jgi:hypothetical protein
MRGDSGSFDLHVYRILCMKWISMMNVTVLEKQMTIYINNQNVPFNVFLKWIIFRFWK